MANPNMKVSVLVELVDRLTAPLRGLARAICSGRRPGVRRRERAASGEETDDYAPAI